MGSVRPPGESEGSKSQPVSSSETSRHRGHTYKVGGIGRSLRDFVSSILDFLGKIISGQSTSSTQIKLAKREINELIERTLRASTKDEWVSVQKGWESISERTTDKNLGEMGKVIAEKAKDASNKAEILQRARDESRRQSAPGLRRIPQDEYNAAKNAVMKAVENIRNIDRYLIGIVEEDASKAETNEEWGLVQERCEEIGKTTKDQELKRLADKAAEKAKNARIKAVAYENVHKKMKKEKLPLRTEENELEEYEKAKAEARQAIEKMHSLRGLGREVSEDVLQRAQKVANNAMVEGLQQARQIAEEVGLGEELKPDSYMTLFTKFQRADPGTKNEIREELQRRVDETRQAVMNSFEERQRNILDLEDSRQIETRQLEHANQLEDEIKSLLEVLSDLSNALVESILDKEDQKSEMTSEEQQLAVQQIDAWKVRLGKNAEARLKAVKGKTIDGVQQEIKQKEAEKQAAMSRYMIIRSDREQRPDRKAQTQKLEKQIRSFATAIAFQKGLDIQGWIPQQFFIHPDIISAIREELTRLELHENARKAESYISSNQLQES